MPGISGFWLQFWCLKKCKKSIESEGHDTRFWKFWTENKPISAENLSKMSISNKKSKYQRKWTILEIKGWFSSKCGNSTHFQNLSGNEVIFEINFENLVKKHHEWDLNFKLSAEITWSLLFFKNLSKNQLTFFQDFENELITGLVYNSNSTEHEVDNDASILLITSL